jgi:hypothetical protein
MPMSETKATANSILLREHEATGLLPVGFEFEASGATYDHFDVSTDGYITFARGSRHAGLPGRLRLTGEGTRLGRGRVTYEVRGLAPRRRLVVSLEDEAPMATPVRITVHERTGIVEVGPGGQSFGEPTIRQLDMVHSSWSRANSARKMG